MKTGMLVVRRTAVALREVVVLIEALPLPPAEESPWPDRIAFWLSAAAGAGVGARLCLHALPRIAALGLQTPLGVVGGLVCGVMLYAALSSRPGLAVIGWLLRFWWVMALAGIAVRLFS